MNEMHKTAICLLLLFTLLLPCLSYALDNTSERNMWLLSVAFKLEKMRDAAEDMQMSYDNQIIKCIATIGRMQGFIDRAVQKRNVQAEQSGRQELTATQEAMRKIQADWSSAVARKAKAEQALAMVRNLMAESSSTGAEIQAVVTNFFGKALYYSKRLKESIPLGAKGSGGLEAGDEITTDANSKLHIQFLEGRGAMDLYEKTRLKIEQSNNGCVMGLEKGKIHVKVAKPEDFEKDMEESLAAYKDSLYHAGGLSQPEIDRKVQMMSYWWLNYGKKKYQVRTPAAELTIKNTRFMVSEDSSKGTELAVFDGTVEMTGLKDKKNIPVNAGYRIKAAVDGTLSEPEKLDTTEIDRWWEK